MAIGRRCIDDLNAAPADAYPGAYELRAVVRWAVA